MLKPAVKLFRFPCLSISLLTSLKQTTQSSILSMETVASHTVSLDLEAFEGVVVLVGARLAEKH
jgi:hypothetical protein